MARKGEFQNRDRDEASDLSGIPLAGSLGELPEDLSNERGDLDNYATRAAAQMAPDMASAQRGRVDAAGTGLGSPKIDYSVRSVYDSRPINHREFNLWFYGNLINEPPAVITTGVFERCFFVPSGYAMVLRRVTFLLNSLTSNTLLAQDGLFTIVVNGGIVDPMQVEAGPAFIDAEPVQQNIPWRSGEPTDTFILADEGDAIGVQATIEGVLDWTDPDFFSVGFYGQFLLKTGVPAQFQAANEAGRARSAVTTGRNDLALSTGEGVTLTRRKKLPFPNVPILRGK